MGSSTSVGVATLPSNNQPRSGRTCRPQGEAPIGPRPWSIRTGEGNCSSGISGGCSLRGNKIETGVA